jgi:hypothetical protein
VYHLSYQEELWAESEQQTEQKKSSKKSKNKKKKEKAKQKKAKPEPDLDVVEKGDAEQLQSTVEPHTKGSEVEMSTLSEPGEFVADEEQDDDNDLNHHPPHVDFVLYLQQTGSIIALAKLMDALDDGEDFNESLDDSELKLIREQHMLSSQ